MKKGKKSIESLGEYQKYELLKEIVGLCIENAGDSYEDFAKPVVKLLVKNKLVDYGK
jgi:hypothetical protein